jgi:hypothetical protein
MYGSCGRRGDLGHREVDVGRRNGYLGTVDPPALFSTSALYVFDVSPSEWWQSTILPFILLSFSVPGSQRPSSPAWPLPIMAANEAKNQSRNHMVDREELCSRRKLPDR